jgi:hypothetical protein
LRRDADTGSNSDAGANSHSDPDARTNGNAIPYAV